MLATNVYRENVKLIAVDEAHCISHWGFTPRKGDKIFRIWFSRINELRSIVPAGVPLLALTATATKRTRERVMHALEMKDAIVIKDNPNRPNITYSVQIVGNKTFETFQPLITQVELLGATCDRVIIYCQTVKITTMIYAHFQAELAQNMYKDKIEDPKNRIVEMFHARIDELNKNHILASFAHENGCIRVLIATIAYGMGIDCKAVKTIIHYGPSRNLTNITTDYLTLTNINFSDFFITSQGIKTVPETLTPAIIMLIILQKTKSFKTIIYLTLLLYFGTIYQKT